MIANNYQNYLKGIVVTAGAVLGSLASIYGNSRWYVVAVLVVTAVTTVLVPNVPSKTSTTENIPPTL